MNDIEFVIKKCATYEQFLEKKFSASGRGLHEKVSSVEHSLSAGIVKKLKFIARIRNKMMHEADYAFHDDKNNFMDVCDEIEKELKGFPRSNTKKTCDSPQSNTKKTCDIEQQPPFKIRFLLTSCILIIFGVIGLFLFYPTSDTSDTSELSLDDKINNKYQEILDLEDQIKHETFNIEAINEKYPKIRFWKNKSREDLIETEKAEARIKILDAKKSRAQNELSFLKQQIDYSGPIDQGPLIMLLTIIIMAYSFYKIVVGLKKKNKSRKIFQG